MTQTQRDNPATSRMIEFITRLANERDIPEDIGDHGLDFERTMDALGGKTITFQEARSAIEWLKTLPFLAGVKPQYMRTYGGRRAGGTSSRALASPAPAPAPARRQASSPAIIADEALTLLGQMATWPSSARRQAIMKRHDELVEALRSTGA